MLCGLFADILFFGLNLREIFISRNWLQEVDEGLVFRCGRDAPLLQFIGVHGLEGARDSRQVLKEPPHNEGGGAVALSGPDVDSAVLEIGDGYGDVFHGHRATLWILMGVGASEFGRCFLSIDKCAPIGCNYAQKTGVSSDARR